MSEANTKIPEVEMTESISAVSSILRLAELAMATPAILGKIAEFSGHAGAAKLTATYNTLRQTMDLVDCNIWMALSVQELNVGREADVDWRILFYLIHLNLKPYPSGSFGLAPFGNNGTRSYGYYRRDKEEGKRVESMAKEGCSRVASSILGLLNDAAASQTDISVECSGELKAENLCTALRRNLDFTPFRGNASKAYCRRVL